MKRLLTEVKNNIIVQFRNGLYHVSIGVGVLVAIAMSQLIAADIISLAMITLMLLIVGGSTFLYVAAMYIFELDEGTISATLVSPLSIGEYIGAKAISLTILASLESVIMFFGALLIMYFQGVQIILPNIAVLFIALFSICIIFVLMGVILVVRFRKITDFIMPMAALIIFLQIPIVYFFDFSDNWVFLLFPVSPPTMLMLGAFDTMENWQYIYAISYSLICIFGLFYWANKAFAKHAAGGH